MLNIADLSIVSAEVRAKLMSTGIKTLTDLAALHTSPRQCFEVSQSTGISLEKLRWIVNVALFNQVHGIGVNHSVMLIKIGIDSVEKLAKSSPERLYENMSEYNLSQSVLHILPSVLVISRWVEEARAIVNREGGIMQSFNLEDPSGGN